MAMASVQEGDTRGTIKRVSGTHGCSAGCRVRIQRRRTREGKPDARELVERLVMHAHLSVATHEAALHYSKVLHHVGTGSDGRLFVHFCMPCPDGLRR